MKRALAILILTLIFFPLLSAVQIDLNSEFRQGEILTAKISGNFLEPVLKENIYFYREYVQVPFEFELLKIETDYYIYTSTIGKIPGNYSLVIKDSEYYIAGGKTTDDDIIRNFSINEEQADFSALPGVVVTDSTFLLEIQNLKEEQIKVYIDKNAFAKEEKEQGFFASLFGSKENEISHEKEITLKAGEIKQVELEFENVSSPVMKNVRLSTDNFTTNIFIYVLSGHDKENSQKKSIKFEIDFFNVTMATSSNAIRILYLINNGNTTFENVTLTVSDSLKDYILAEPAFIDELKANETEKIILNISSKNKSEIINGSINAKTLDNISDNADIYLNILKDFVPEKNQTNPEEAPASSKTCAKNKGIICQKNQTCTTEPIISKDGSCCLSECKEKKKSSTGKIIGWTVIILLIILYIWFYFRKYKKTNKKVDLLKIAEGKKED